MKIHNSAILETFLNANGVCEYSNKNVLLRNFNLLKNNIGLYLQSSRPLFE